MGMRAARLKPGLWFGGIYSRGCNFGRRPWPAPRNFQERSEKVCHPHHEPATRDPRKEDIMTYSEAVAAHEAAHAAAMREREREAEVTS